MIQTEAMPELGSLFTEPLLLAAGAIAVAALVRGLSGFGAAMVFIPIGSLLYDPATAIVMLFVADNLVTLPAVIRARHHCVWREILPLAAGGFLMLPFGAYVLATGDPLVLRWLICGLVIAAVAVLASGWRYRGSPSLATAVGVGGLSGFSGGVASLWGPPVIIFWLGGPGAAHTTRANVLVLFAILGVGSGIAYLANGLVTQERLLLAALMVPVYGLTFYAGAWAFRLFNDRHYRQLALVVCAASAVIALPLWG